MLLSLHARSQLFECVPVAVPGIPDTFEFGFRLIDTHRFILEAKRMDRHHGWAHSLVVHWKIIARA